MASAFSVTKIATKIASKLKETEPLFPTWEGQERRIKTLLGMLTYRRKGGSKAERSFINRYLRPLGVTFDAYGNAIKRIGAAPVLWSSHTDTVHRKAGRQRVYVDPNGWVTTDSGDCLGADCAAGVWIMCEMIRAGIEGLYVFHRDEEMGGGGSSHIAGMTPELLEGINYAIAFDRKGFDSVITYQFGDRCCSEEFATSLGKAIGGHEWKNDDSGTFTDTANYVDLVPECTNLSVGYFDQHTPRERLHLGFISGLLDNLLCMNAEDLPVVRDPLEKDPEDKAWFKDYGYADWSRSYYSGHEDDNMSPGRSSARIKRDDLAQVVRDCPDAVVAFLEHYGATADEIMQYAAN